jgi:hypothetical protein
MALAARASEPIPTAHPHISFNLHHRPEIEAEIEANSLEAALETNDATLGEDGVIRFRKATG